MNAPDMEILIATSNSGKIREIEEALRDVPIRLRYLREFPEISAVEEIGKTYEENAVLKAVSYSKQSGRCALADDSGLEVDALGGLPGVRSARYGSANVSDQQRTEKLLIAINKKHSSERTARFVCCMALAGWPSKKRQASSDEPTVIHISRGTCEGRIVETPRGNNGFGYDPLFVPLGYDRTFGELRSTIKNVISHRAQALAAMQEFLMGRIA